ncbi:MAG TPA: acylphosphatase [Bacteroidales bacterium]|nr:acylphosphatase [Bacteroidales bacterium]HRZ49061.1 acylphosphatase [Bacteroidales bacterium]
MTGNENKRLKIRITGKVQGVGFRFFTQRSACTLGIKGYVENASDGSVVIEAEGSPVQLSQFVKFVEQGPQWAWVEEVEKTEVPPRGDEQFTVY